MMTYLTNALALLVLIVVVEKAMMVHGKLSMSTSLGVGDNVPDPPLLKPRWRLAIYLTYLVLGSIAFQGNLPKVLAGLVIVIPIVTLTALDLIALRKALLEQQDAD